jgi:hypothetical protein
VRQIYKKEGMYGFGRGFSACYYGSIFFGFTYFFLYKFIKQKEIEVFGHDINPTVMVLTASVIAEIITLLVCFPFDLIKCRL